MTRVGSYLGKYLAPRVDKVLIPRTNGHLSTMGRDKVGLVTTTGAKSGRPRPQPLALLDNGDGCSRSGPITAARSTPGGAPTCWPTPNAPSSSTARARPTEPNCCQATSAPRPGRRPSTSTPDTRTTA